MKIMHYINIRTHYITKGWEEGRREKERKIDNRKNASKLHEKESRKEQSE